MTLTTKFMKWDGICFAEPVRADLNRRDWRNQNPVGAAPGPRPNAPGYNTLASNPNYGATLTTPKAEVTLIAISEMFAPIEEYAVIELQFKDIEHVGCLVLQIKDADDQLVYAERLTRDMVRQLPDTRAAVEALSPPLSKLPGPLSAQQKTDRSKAKWATPVGTPYSIKVWVTNNVCRDVLSSAELHLDVSREIRKSPSREALNPYFVEEHRVKNPGRLAPNPPPALAINQTSVRLTERLAPVFVPWEEVFERLTGKEFPQVTGGLTNDEEKVLWAKCRLNQIGFSAGPIDTKKTQDDFLKASKRYAAMRGLGGKVHYRIKDSLVDGLPSPYDQPDFTQLLASLEKERLLAQDFKAFSNSALLGDGGSEPLKVYIDANWYFTTTSEKKDATEREWLTPPCLPIRVRLPVLRRDGRTAADVPEVLEPLFFQWTWRSPAEDANRLPDPTAPRPIAAFGGSFDEATTFHLDGPSAQVYAGPQRRSKARNYLDATRRRMRRAAGGYPPDQPNEHHNAAYYVGGQIAGDAARNLQVVFQTLDRDPAGTEHRVRPRSASGLEPYLLAANVVADANSPSRNGAVSTAGPYIYFCPSLLAGDQYELTAELFLEQQRTAKCADFGATPARKIWMDAFCVPAPAVPPAPRFKGSTRRLEAWRRLRIARFVQWGAQPTTYDGKPFDLHAVWEAVKKEYGFAYIEFENCALPGSPPPCTPANLSALLPSTNHVVAATLPVCRVQDLVLEDAHYRNRGAKLLQTGVKAEYNSIAEAVNALLRGSANGVTAGRTVPPDQFVFSPDRILPPLPINPLTLAARNLPQITEVLEFVFLPSLELYKKIQNNSLAGDEQERFRSAYLFLRDWQQIDHRAGPVQLAIKTIGDRFVQALSRVIEYTPGPAGGTFSWKKESGADVDPKALGTPFNGATGDLLIPPDWRNEFDEAYAHRQFAQIMDLFFMVDTETSVRGECMRWVRGESLSAERALGLLAVIEPLQRVPGPLWEGDEHTGDFRPDKHYYTGWALRRYREYFGFVLDVPNRKFKDLPSEQRNLMLCMVYPDIVEATVHNARYANKVIYEHPDKKALGEQLAWCLDQIIRKGLLCQTDASGQFQNFADGIIVLNARVYPTIRIENEPFEVAGPSVGFPLGLVFTSHRSAMEPYALLAHEIAHVVYMQHDRNTQASYILHHDHEDHNCMMSYPLNELPNLASVPPTVSNTYETNRLTRYVYLHINGWPELVDFMNDPAGWNANRESVRAQGNFLPNSPVPIFRPHFCGKCLLRLRGWNIHAQMAAATAPPSLEPAAPAAAGPGGPGPGGGPPMGPAALALPMGPLGAMAPMMWGAAGASAAAPAAAGPFNWDDPANLDPVTSGHPDLLPLSSGLPFHKQDRVNRQFPVGMVYPQQAQEVTVQAGDTLCSIAAAVGLINCYPIWAHPKNTSLGTRPIAPGQKVYVPTRKAGEAALPIMLPTLHFIRGANAAEPDLPHLNLTNYHPGKGGLNGDQLFPDKNVRTHHADGYADDDAFQVEIEYPDGFALPAKVPLKLAALLPTYAADGSVTGHTDFPAAEATARSLDIELAPSGISPKRLRSCYLRLISIPNLKNEAEWRPEQTLLISDYAGTDARVETFDQKVRALIRVPGCGCPKGNECQVKTEFPMEPARKKVNLAIRILRENPSGVVESRPGGPGDNGVVQLSSVKTTADSWVRDIFAPAHLKIVVSRLETVDPPSGIIAISDLRGISAPRDLDVSFRLRVVRAGGGESTHNVGPVHIARDSTPYVTAQAVQRAIAALSLAGVTAVAHENPVIAGASFAQGCRGADVYFQCAAGVRVIPEPPGTTELMSIGLEQSIAVLSDFIIVASQPGRNSPACAFRFNLTIKDQSVNPFTDLWSGAITANIPDGASQDEVANTIAAALNSELARPAAALRTRLLASVRTPVEAPLKRRISIESGSDTHLIKMSGAELTGAAYEFSVEYVNIDLDQDLLIDNTAQYIHIGTPQQRCLFYAFDTQPNEIPIIFPTTKNLAGRFGGTALGYAVGDFTRVESAPGGAAPTPHPRVRNTILLMPACATPDKPYLFAHEIGHLMIGNALHVPGDYQDDSKTDYYNALMWGDPGSADKKPHFFIDGHDGGRPNYTEFRFLPDRTFVKEQLAGGASNSPGRVSYNCVARILAHSCAVAP